MPLYLVRHGATRLSGRFCGVSNPPLNADGRAQARTARRALSRAAITMCYCSPSLRARQTARLVWPDGPIRVCAGLRELNFGAWEGLRFSEIETRWPARAKAWARHPLRARIPNGETMASLRQRIRRFLRTIKPGNALIVAHGGSLAALIVELLKRPGRELPGYIPPRGSVQRFSEGRLRRLC